jgi:hypothetical protein
MSWGRSCLSFCHACNSWRWKKGCTAARWGRTHHIGHEQSIPTVGQITKTCVFIACCFLSFLHPSVNKKKVQKGGLTIFRNGIWRRSSGNAASSRNIALVMSDRMVKVTSVGLKQDGEREKQGFRLVLLSRLAFKLHSSERVIANVSCLSYRPLELQAVRISRQSAHEGGTGRLYPSGDAPGTHFVKKLSRSHDYTADWRMKSEFFCFVFWILCLDCPGLFVSLCCTTHSTNIHAPGGFRIGSPNKRPAKVPRLTPRGHRVWQIEPAIFQLLPQCSSNYATAYPRY